MTTSTDGTPLALLTGDDAEYLTGIRSRENVHKHSFTWQYYQFEALERYAMRLAAEGRLRESVAKSYVMEIRRYQRLVNPGLNQVTMQLSPDLETPMGRSGSIAICDAAMRILEELREKDPMRAARFGEASPAPPSAYSSAATAPAPAPSGGAWRDLGVHCDAASAGPAAWGRGNPMQAGAAAAPQHDDESGSEEDDYDDGA